MPHKSKAVNGSHIVYNLDLLDTVTECLFDHEKQAAKSESCYRGRGMVLLFEHEDLELVLKRYHRGGMMSRLIKESYLYMRLNKTRMWREFYLLDKMQDMGLPVPRPVAARCQRISPLTYRGDLISEKIPQSRTLAETICHGPLPDETWNRVGQVIASFHQHDIYHADLNANNILLTPDGKVYLIDFDKSEIRHRLKFRWTRANLNRLQRSLEKLGRQVPGIYFSEHNWHILNRAYMKYSALFDETSAQVPSRS
ncbi:MAG: 3-deoxy-D-manno-octulosonic acid kinase [Pseudohongiellaceae bacterium]